MELNFMEDCSEVQATSVVNVSHLTAVVVMDGKVLYVKRRGNSTLELPTIVPKRSEKPVDAVNRLLKDSLSADVSRVEFVTVFSQTDGNDVEYGMLYIVEVTSLRTLNDPELCASYFLDIPPVDHEKWTSPETDIPLLEKAMEIIKK